MGLKNNALRSLAWHHLPTKFHENLPICSKVIHRSFIPKASDACRSFLLYSKPQAMVSIVTSLPLWLFCPTVKYMLWLSWLHQLNIGTWCYVTWWCITQLYITLCNIAYHRTTQKIFNQNYVKTLLENSYVHSKLKRGLHMLWALWFTPSLTILST
jgi:hypothetical protein